MADIDPYSLKHRPVFLLPYEAYDGPYAGKSDCKFISVGWAQYDARSVSVKTMRHTGEKWSRLAEEVPIHRSVDAALTICLTLDAVTKNRRGAYTIPKGTFEHQIASVVVPSDIQTDSEGRAFHREMTDPVLTRRLGKLREVLNALHASGEVP